MDAINPLMTRNSVEQVVIHWGIRFPLKLMDYILEYVGRLHSRPPV